MTLAEVGADSWFNWHKSFVIDGNCMQENEKNGSLEFLTPNRQTVLGTLKFKNLGIFKIAPDDTQAADTARRVKAEMYCEQMVYEPAPDLK